MCESIVKKVLLVAVMAAAGLVVVTVGDPSSGQEAKEKKAKGRLPPYYADIVTEEQRTAIYAIQERYSQRIGKLREQLEALEAQEDAEIEGVLNAAQKQKLREARDAAAAKKKKKADDKKAAEGSKKADEAKADGDSKKASTTDKKKPK